MNLINFIATGFTAALAFIPVVSNVSSGYNNWKAYKHAFATTTTTAASAAPVIRDACDAKKASAGLLSGIPIPAMATTTITKLVQRFWMTDIGLKLCPDPVQVTTVRSIPKKKIPNRGKAHTPTTAAAAGAGAAVDAVTSILTAFIEAPRKWISPTVTAWMDDTATNLKMKLGIVEKVITHEQPPATGTAADAKRAFKEWFVMEEIPRLAYDFYTNNIVQWWFSFSNNTNGTGGMKFYNNNNTTDSNGATTTFTTTTTTIAATGIIIVYASAGCIGIIASLIGTVHGLYWLLNTLISILASGVLYLVNPAAKDHGAATTTKTKKTTTTTPSKDDNIVGKKIAIFLIVLVVLVVIELALGLYCHLVILALYLKIIYEVGCFFVVISDPPRKDPTEVDETAPLENPNIRTEPKKVDERYAKLNSKRGSLEKIKYVPAHVLQNHCRIFGLSTGADGVWVTMEQLDAALDDLIMVLRQSIDCEEKVQEKVEELMFGPYFDLTMAIEYRDLLMYDQAQSGPQIEELPSDS